MARTIRSESDYDYDYEILSETKSVRKQKNKKDRLKTRQSLRNYDMIRNTEFYIQ